MEFSLDVLWSQNEQMRMSIRNKCVVRRRTLNELFTNVCACRHRDKQYVHFTIELSGRERVATAINGTVRIVHCNWIWNYYRHIIYFFARARAFVDIPRNYFANARLAFWIVKVSGQPGGGREGGTDKFDNDDCSDLLSNLISQIYIFASYPNVLHVSRIYIIYHYKRAFTIRGGRGGSGGGATCSLLDRPFVR